MLDVQLQLQCNYFNNVSVMSCIGVRERRIDQGFHSPVAGNIQRVSRLFAHISERRIV